MKYLIAMVVVMFATFAYADMNNFASSYDLLNFNLPVSSETDKLSINGYSVILLFVFALIGFSLFVNRRKL